MPTILLTGAGGSAAANVLDALRLSGGDYRVVGADSSAIRLHLSQADVRCVLPRADDPRYADDLTAAIAQWDIDVVHPQPDPEVLAVGELRDELAAATFLPRQAALVVAGDKAAFAQRMAQAGVPVPESQDIGKETDVAEVTADLLQRHETAWVRARVGAGARASLPVSTVDQAVAWIAWWVEERGLEPHDFMVAERLPGREFAYQSIWQNGHLVAGQARERVEYLYGFLTPSGQTSTPAVARTVSDARVDDLAQAAIRALDPEPSGVFCVDIKEDAFGAPKVTEINAGRFFTTSNFFAAAGLNMPDMAMRAARGETLPRVGSSPLEADLYWIRMVDMGYVLVAGDDIDPWVRPHR